VGVILFDVKLHRLCCCGNTISWTFLLLRVVGFVVLSQGQCKVLERSGFSPCWRSFCNADLDQPRAKRIRQIYLLGVRLFDVWFEDIGLLEVMDKISEMEVFGREALVVSDVGNLRHIDLLSWLIVGKVVLELMSGLRLMEYFADGK
jgi:hypothetical protein